MSDIKCVVCQSEHFRKGYYDVDVDVEIYSTIYNDVRSDGYIYIDNNFHDLPSINVNSEASHEVTTKNDIDLKIENEEWEKKDYYNYDETAKVYKYICEDCGYIMSFTQEKNVKSKEQEKRDKQKANTYDWTHFK